MSDHNLWRTQCAQEVGARYACHSEVEAVALIGSVARGWADAYSDIEIAVFWAGDPQESARQSVVEQVGGAQERPAVFDSDVQAWCEEYLFRGVKIDLGHWSVGTMEAIVGDVVDTYDPALAKHTSVSALLSAVPLHGDALLRHWQNRASTYPQALAEAVVRHHLSFSPMWMLRMLAERGDFPLVRRNLAALTHKLYLVLCALNGVYYPGHKWMPRHIAEMKVIPPHFLARLEAALAAPPRAAVAEFEDFIAQTLVLVDLHLPNIDTATVRTRLGEPAHHFPHNRLTRSIP